MKKLLQKIKKIVNKFRFKRPSKLPVGLAEFETWSNSIIETYDAPDNDSSKFMLAVAILHLGSTDADKPKEFFGRSIHKAMANQVVSQVIQDLKTKQEEAAAAAQAKPVEATTIDVAPNDAQT